MCKNLGNNLFTKFMRLFLCIKIIISSGLCALAQSSKYDEPEIVTSVVKQMIEEINDANKKINAIKTGSCNLH